MSELLAVDDVKWVHELELVKKRYEHFGDRLPVELNYQVEAIGSRLKIEIKQV
jgi:GTP-dependent phosphoenolpyruvate carboxykinase